MKIQSLSIVVPTEKCICRCPFCISKNQNQVYPNYMDESQQDYHIHLTQYMKRLQYAKDNGCNNIIITGTGEPQQNKNFLNMFGMMMKQIPFSNIELQTTGVLLDEDTIKFLRDHVGVSTISLSTAYFENHFIFIGVPRLYTLEDICLLVKSHHMKLRLSINLTSFIEEHHDSMYDLFEMCRDQYHADQLTFRVLQSSFNSKQSTWIEKYEASEEFINDLTEYIHDHGRPMTPLDYGATPYAIDDMSVVVDHDCQDRRISDDIRYLILRPDCQLYSKWDDKGSII